MIDMQDGSGMDGAARWVARMDAGGWSDDDEADLRRWLAVDPRRAGWLLRAQAAWMTTDPAIAPEIVVPRERTARRRLLGYGAAALAASFVGVLIWSAAPVRYETAVGEIRRVPLADGSVAAINTDSALTVSLGERIRTVDLTAGEAWFQVAKDGARPFLVTAGRVRVRAVGTAFSVRRQGDGAVILVNEGAVEAWVVGVEDHRMRVMAGGRLSFAAASAADDVAIDVRAEPPSAVDRALAWRSGRIDLDGVSVGTAVSEFNRYNARRLVIVDPRLVGVQLEGVFRVDDPAGFAAAVGIALGVPVDASRTDRVLIGRAD